MYMTCDFGLPGVSLENPDVMVPSRPIGDGKLLGFGAGQVPSAGGRVGLRPVPSVPSLAHPPSLSNPAALGILSAVGIL